MKKFIWFLFFLAVSQGYAQKQSGILLFKPQIDTLYPPPSFWTVQIESTAMLYWSKPVMPGGDTPPGLLGYFLYRNDICISFIENPDTLYFDYNLEPGQYIYKATAYYDLTPYGFPGQFGESCFSNSDETYVGARIMPFWEFWDQASFYYNDWRFSPSQGNWDISMNNGNPPPTVLFRGIPDMNNFNFRLMSPFMFWYHACSQTIVEFDLNMDAVNPGPAAQLFLDVYYDSIWYTKAAIDNANTNGWIHNKYDITETNGVYFRIGFRAAGLSSSVINSWMIDNIMVHPICKSPDSVGYFLSDNVVTFYWEYPCHQADTLQSEFSIYGYNVFRTDSTGLPPYVKLNHDPVTDTFYVDTLPESMLKGKFRYCMNVIYMECYSDTSLSVLVSPSAGIAETENKSIRIFPNPASELIQIQSEIALEAITLWSGTGVVQYHLQNLNNHDLSIPIENLSNGVYWIGIMTRSGYVIRKVIILHQ